MGVNEYCPGGERQREKKLATVCYVYSPYLQIKIIQKKKLYLHWIAVDNLCHRSLTLH